MTLALRYVAICDACSERHVFDSSSLLEVRKAMRPMGWRHGVWNNGLETRCGSCMEKLDKETQARLNATTDADRPEWVLERPRKRQGWHPCPDCGDMVAFDNDFYRPRSKEHPTNRVCLTCATRAATRYGYRVDTAKYLSVDPETRVTRTEPQPALFTDSTPTKPLVGPTPRK